MSPVKPISIQDSSMQINKSLLIFFLLSLLISIVGVNVQVRASEKPEYFFYVHMIAPTSSTVRMQYAQLMEGELAKIGIGTKLELVSWGALGPRCYKQEVGMYSEGGYDVCIFGMHLGTPERHPGASLQGIFGANAIPPEGFNTMYWSPELGKNYNNYRAQESDDLIQKIATNLNLSETRKDLIEWQKLWYDVMPNVLIYNQYEVHAISTGLYGYDPVAYPLNSIEDVWLTSDFTGTAGHVVLAASTGGETFNPLLTTDVYDQYGNNPAFDGLVGNTPSKEAVLPTGTVRATWMTDNYNTTDYLALYPRVADSMGSYSSDGLSYAVDLRDDVYFHDGHQVDAWDIAMSFQAHIISDMGASSYSNLIVPFGEDDKTNKHGNYSFTVIDEDSDGFDEHINFTLNTTYAPFETDYLGVWIFPEHILGDPINHGFDPTTGDFDPDNQWLVAPGDWQYHSTTTGRTTDPGGYEGPISCGSMIFKEFDSLNNIVKLEKFYQTKWDNATGDWIDDATLSHWNIDNLEDMPDSAKVILSSMDAGLVDMKTGGINILDPQFTMANILDKLQNDSTIQPILSPETGWPAIYFNPKFVQDDIYHFQRKGVRHAISHMVPREDIITYLMNGLGLPAYTPIPVTSWAAISESELLEYKKTLQATDNSTPESNAVAAFDEYSIDKAFDWLDTEGYNTTEWRQYTEVPTTSSTRGFLPGFEFFGVVILIVILTIHSILRRKKL